MLRRALLIGLALFLGGCGNSLEETRKSLQGTWIAGAYLDALESTRSPLSASRTLSGISDFHYDADRDSAVFAFAGGKRVGMRGMTMLGDGAVHFAGDSLTITFSGPRGADRMKIGPVELRRISRVPEMTITEYLVRRLFAGTYRILAPQPAGSDTVRISYDGGVTGLGEFVMLTPVADYGGPFPTVDAVMLETLFHPDTLYYSWTSRGDTLAVHRLKRTDSHESHAPKFPGEAFTLLRQRQ